MASIVYDANTNDLELVGLFSDFDGTYLNSATVTVTVNDSNGVPVTGESWPQAMPYVTASNGNYLVGLSHSIDFMANKKYTAVIDADGSSMGVERIGHWEFQFTAKTRTS